MTLKKRYIRWAAWAVTVVMVYLLFIQWQRDFAQQGTVGTSTQDTGVLIEQSESQAIGSGSDKIRIVTDVLDLIIDLKGGDLVSAKLTNYRDTIESPEPVQLLSDDESRFYVVRSGLAGASGPDSGASRPLYTSDRKRYTLHADQQSLVVALQHVTDAGVTITKEYTFRANDYLVSLRYFIENESDAPFSSRFFGQIVRANFVPNDGFSGVGVKSYLGGALTTPETAYEKVDFDDMDGADLNIDVKGGWIAMIQHYFTSAWIPEPSESYSYQTRTTKNNKYIWGFVGAESSVLAGQHQEIDASIYIGPKILERLNGLAENIDLTIDFGWLWFLAIPLFYVLDFLHAIVGNWGLSIILLTCIVKLIFFYPSHISYSSMARMRKLTPQMKSIKDTYANDKQKLQQEMMALYKREKVNPLGGCLPILIQMPVFIALYWMLLESVELRHAPFILWIEDLSALDPYFIMPLIMGGTMFLQQLLSPAPPDPTQAKIMRLMPVVFTFLFLWFPAGLVLYWITNNSLSILQQWLITKRIAAKTP